MKKNKLLVHYLKWGSILFVSLLVFVCVFVFRDKLQQLRSLGLLGIFLANLVSSLTLFIPAPGIATVVAGGTIYPPIFVGVVASLGATIGDCVGYIVGHSGKKVLLKTHGKTYGRIITLFRKWGGLVVFVFAFVPNPLFDGVGIVAGALQYPLYKFFLWLFLGRLARNLLLAYFGFTLTSL